MTERKEHVRVLIVDDDTTVATGLADLLETYRFDVRIASTGSEALPAAESFSPDVVLLDVRLPDRSGAEVFCDLRRRWPRLAVIFSSGHVSDLGDVVEGKPSRVALLRKPYSGEQLVRAIECVIR